MSRLDRGARPVRTRGSPGASAFHVHSPDVRSNEPHDDATTAELVRMLAAAGWSTTAVPEHGGERPLELAKQRQKPLTAAQLQGGA